MLQTQKHMKLGAAVLTLTWLCSEVLHDTNLDTPEPKGSST